MTIRARADPEFQIKRGKNRQNRIEFGRFSPLSTIEIVTYRSPAHSASWVCVQSRVLRAHWMRDLICLGVRARSLIRAIYTMAYKFSLYPIAYKTILSVGPYKSVARFLQRVPATHVTGVRRNPLSSHPKPASDKRIAKLWVTHAEPRRHRLGRYNRFVPAILADMQISLTPQPMDNLWIKNLLHSMPYI